LIYIYFAEELPFKLNLNPVDAGQNFGSRVGRAEIDMPVCSKIAFRRRFSALGPFAILSFADALDDRPQLLE
jgi:hypothetical protein